MSEPANSRDSPNVEPQSLRPAGHDVSSSNTEKEEDHYLVGESSYRDALRQEGTTRPKELSPESGHSHQTRSTGEPLLWHLGISRSLTKDLKPQQAQNKLRGGTASKTMEIAEV